jgi:hypothetical protein
MNVKGRGRGGPAGETGETRGWWWSTNDQCTYEKNIKIHENYINWSKKYIQLIFVSKNCETCT